MPRKTTCKRRRKPPTTVVMCAVGLSVVSGRATAQELPHITASRGVIVAGLSSEPTTEDVLYLGRTKFSGVIAAELAGAGVPLRSAAERSSVVEAPPLSLFGTLKEETCDGPLPSQCRVAIQWELQDVRGRTIYRTTTRAVASADSFERERRALVEDAVHSLLRRRRFLLQFQATGASVAESPSEPLGFKSCQRPDVSLPGAAHTVAFATVLVASGSSLSRGAIVSPDGLILTEARALEPQAPLRVRFAAGQTLPADVVAQDKNADVALLKTSAHTAQICLPVRSGHLATGDGVWGVSSELTEEAATSLTGSVVADVVTAPVGHIIRVDPKIAKGLGAPLLDRDGKLTGVVVTTRSASEDASSVGALDTSDALAALHVRPASITDPRLAGTVGETLEAGYVRDADDPPFAMTQRYTYGTAPSAHTLRTVGLATTGVGLAGVVFTWFSYRAATNPTPAQRNRFVIENDVSWVLVGLGAAGVGVSYVLPERHDVVDVDTEAGGRSASSRRELFIGVGADGLSLRARL